MLGQESPCVCRRVCAGVSPVFVFCAGVSPVFVLVFFGRLCCYVYHYYEKVSSCYVRICVRYYYHEQIYITFRSFVFEWRRSVTSVTKDVSSSRGCSFPCWPDREPGMLGDLGWAPRPLMVVTGLLPVALHVLSGVAGIGRGLA